MSTFQTLALSLSILVISPLLVATESNNYTKLGGDTSIKASGRNAYSMPAANMPMSQRLDFSVGNSFF
jgi:CxxC motif-containing protein (DUF1111 family)